MKLVPAEQTYELYPEDWYRSRLVSHEVKDSTNPAFGDHYSLWQFELLEAGYEGKKIAVMTSARMSDDGNLEVPKGTKAHVLCDALHGKPLEEADINGVEDLYGMECLLHVEVKTKPDGSQRNIVA